MRCPNHVSEVLTSRQCVLDEGHTIPCRPAADWLEAQDSKARKLAESTAPAPPALSPSLSLDGYCGICYHALDQCSHCDKSAEDDWIRIATKNAEDGLRRQAELESERRVLIKDHSVALEFVREMTAKKCPAECGACIICRATAWLHTEDRQPSPSWLQIETAPKDGTPFIAANRWDAFRAFYDVAESVWIAEDSGLWFGQLKYPPTHWMPLPAPPLGLPEQKGTV